MVSPISMNPLVSIGVPTYNRGYLLENIVGIALKQTYKNLQVIVVDNDSTDNRSREALENLSTLNDDRLEIHKNSTNLGVLQNAHEVLMYAEGKYFTWFSDDDWRAPTFIECLVRALEANPEYGFAISEYRDIVNSSTPSLLHTSSREKVFKPLSCESKSKRIINFYLSDHASGKCNLFYSVFVTRKLKNLSLKRASKSWKDLSMDRNISFLYLKENRLLFVDHTLFALRVQNKKLYAYKSGLVISVKTLIDEILFTLANVDSLLQKLIILLIIPYKLLRVLLFRVYLKVFRIYKNSSLAPSRTREAKAINKINSSTNIRASQRLSLHELTMICVATKDVEKAAAALAYSMSDINFEKVVLFSHYKPWNLLNNIHHIQIEPFCSVEEWGYFIIYKLYEYIHTSHVLLIHPDGFVVNANSWSDEFFKYDYIGAPWLFPNDKFSYRSKSDKIVRVGNSVSIRSLALLKAPATLDLKWEPYHGYLHEDGFLCAQHYDLLCARGFTYAPINIAYKFSVENELPSIKNNLDSFAFHDWIGKNKAYPRLSDY